MTDEKQLLILFGSETGNAEDLAFLAGELAENFELEAVVKGMDEISIEEISKFKKLMICCSTWGEGDQPDNAEDLYDEMKESVDNSMEGVHFSVLALGDTAFELFCESGKQWDQILEMKGGTRINERVDCDTDYEDEADEWINTTLEILQGI